MNAPEYVRLQHSTPNAFAYTPSAARHDGVCYLAWSGNQKGNPGGVIYTSTAPYNSDHSKMVWSPHRLAITHLGGPAWEGGDICDPCLLISPGGAFGTKKFVMYYGAGALAPGGNHRFDNTICVATSNDFVTWTRWTGPIYGQSGDNPTAYGFSQPSVVRRTDGLFYMTYVRITASGDYGVYRATSTDGVNFPSPHVNWAPVGGGAPGMDICYDAMQDCWWSVFTYADHEALYRAAAWGAPWIQIALFQPVRSNGSGFVRGHWGERPSGPLISYYGTPPYFDNPYDYDLMELRGVKWDV